MEYLLMNKKILGTRIRRVYINRRVQLPFLKFKLKN